ncbi:MAG: glutamyl-tRNA reductase [Thermodesulfobacteriota bacterium]
MEIVLLGLNHQTAPVAVRERVAFSAAQAEEALGRIAPSARVAEALLISTCNRVEFVCAADDPEGCCSAIKDFLAGEKQVAPKDLSPHLYTYTGDDAVRHLFRVAASLDSMILGEPQILGQVKQSYRLAVTARSSGVLISRLMHQAFAVAKKVRKETGIGDHAVSVSYAAVELAKKIFGELAGKKVLLIGAGEMAELAVEHLIANQASDVLVANRTFERAVDLAGAFSGTPVRFEEIPELLKTADIVISSTGAPGLIVTRSDVKAVMRPRRNRPLFFIDIAVPRDIDPEINRVENAYVYDVDDLSGVVEKNLDERRSEAVKAERIVDTAVVRFRDWRLSLDVVPTIVALRDKWEAMRRQEVEKSLARALKNLSEEERQAVDRLTEAIMNKALHDPVQFLKAEGHRAERRLENLGIARDMFRLDEEQS